MNRKSAAAYISNERTLFEKQSVDVKASPSVDVSVYPNAVLNTVHGFGGAFNEKGWQALSVLSHEKRLEVMRALFDPEEGLGFSVCRVPIGSSDYALDRYSLNETANDIAMKHFSIERDRLHLIPFIKEAMSIQPNLRLWGSAWSPPTWMKDNASFDSGNFLDNPDIYRAYALYLLKFIRAYRAEGLPMEAVAVQNEPGTLTNYPSCDWTAVQYLTFIREFLGPLFQKEGLEDAIMLGTFNQPTLINHTLTVLTDPQARSYVSRAGLQWYALGIVDYIRRLAPGLEIWQTETDCGNWHWLPGYDPDQPQNDLGYAAFTWKLMRDWLKAGVSVYTLWNMVLEPAGRNIDSQKPWPQNCPITVDPQTRQVRYTPMFGAVGSFAKFVPPGSKLVATEGNYADALAFTHPEGRIVTVLYNHKSIPAVLTVRIHGTVYGVAMPPLSFGTLVVEAG
jgi:glucosylceramidase